MVYLLNGLPASFLPTSVSVGKGELFLFPIDIKMCREFIHNAMDDGELVSAIGHESTAHLLTKKLGIPIECNRIEAPSPSESKKGENFYIVFSFTMPRRLVEGERLTEEEILGMPLGITGVSTESV